MKRSLNEPSKKAPVYQINMAKIGQARVKKIGPSV